MTTLRRNLVLGAAGLGLCTAISPAQAEIDPARATAFIESAGRDLVAQLNSTAGTATQRRERVAAVLRRAIDIEGTGRFILGRYWRQASEAEQRQYLQLFDEIIIRNLSARFGEYQGVRFTVGRTQQRSEEDVLVTTQVDRPNSASFALDWRVAEVGGQPKVVDVIAEGTSMRLTTRSEYSSVIQRNGGQVSALLTAMQQQIAQLAAREGR
ncbi:MlaC/ttg2D family ABC transporter substrate-binding protein [Plastoroseomonas arctica]|uniref:ABC transporter substrate-binding protein n=1 Tax=Plastoroseomonas arctica TaxID=1509237 RepID=A0AAF1KN97_9PROT|nr:ABC transporter substrate-binding protein [Plastoroseomonas arctica]MBR0654283.1 ABC transporter substrate-binding protein [Plastoroseomonas arctica]